MGMIIAKYQNKTSRLWGKDCTGSVMGPGRLQLSNGEIFHISDLNIPYFVIHNVPG